MPANVCSECGDNDDAADPTPSVFPTLCVRSRALANDENLVQHDERLAFNATTQKVYRVRTTGTFYTFIAFIYDSVYEGEPPPW
ncbi:hypothetical protein Q1695_003395 [Nippostrongylus brasiliensis]|nr:hypothetical protein Q1695_003395 [Nippostrongylus brasiliensis]